MKMLSAEVQKVTGGRKDQPKRSAETCRKISESKKGFIVSDETRKKLSIAGKGREVSAETRQKISAGQIGKFVSEETRKKLSDYNKGRNLGRKPSEETRAKLRANNKSKKSVKTPIGVFESLRNAAKAHCVDGGTIRKRINRNLEGYSYL